VVALNAAVLEADGLLDDVLSKIADKFVLAEVLLLVAKLLLLGAKLVD
jgi:hypothetical protein